MATFLSQVYRETDIQLNHVVPLDFDSIQELPESHVWTQSGDSSCQYEQHVPAIDLSAPNVVELIGNACRKWGMFHLTNHGVPVSVIGDAEAHAQRLFALPTEQKRRALRGPSGAAGYGVARISPNFSKLMWHEGFTIMGSPAEHAKLILPDQYQEFCDAMENYEEHVKSLAFKLFRIMLKALGIDKEGEETISSAFLHKSEGVLQLNSYPICPNPDQAMGLVPHTDSLLITILHQNDTNGLQIFDEKSSSWLLVPPVSGALTINVGDLMHIISNAWFPSIYHRVVPNEVKHRFTIAYFYGPPPDSMVAPLPELPNHCFRSATVKEYIELKNKHLIEALGLLRI